MGHYGVKRSNVVKTKLPKCALQNFEASFFRCFVSGARIDRLDNIVDLGRNKGICARGVSYHAIGHYEDAQTWQFKEV